MEEETGSCEWEARALQTGKGRSDLTVSIFSGHEIK